MLFWFWVFKMCHGCCFNQCKSSLRVTNRPVTCFSVSILQSLKENVWSDVNHDCSKLIIIFEVLAKILLLFLKQIILNEMNLDEMMSLPFWGQNSRKWKLVALWLDRENLKCVWRTHRLHKRKHKICQFYIEIKDFTW